MTSPVRTFEGSGASTIIPGSKPSVNGLPLAKLSSRSSVSIPTVRISAGAVTTPDRLGRLLVEMQEDTAVAVANLARCPLTTGALFVGLKMSLGILQVLRHGFGRPALGYLVTRTYVGAASAVLLVDGALPQGISSRQAVAVVPSVSATCDVWVF